MVVVLKLTPIPILSRDAWKKYDKITMSEAKKAYVDFTLQVLKAFPDRPQAVDFVSEINATTDEEIHQVLEQSEDILIHFLFPFLPSQIPFQCHNGEPDPFFPSNLYNFKISLPR